MLRRIFKDVLAKYPEPKQVEIVEKLQHEVGTFWTREALPSVQAYLYNNKHIVGLYHYLEANQEQIDLASTKDPKKHISPFHTDIKELLYPFNR